MRSTKDKAQNQWPEILTRLGVDSSILDGRHHPSPVNGGTDGFRFIDKHGDGHYVDHNEFGDGFALLKLIYGWDFKKAAQEIDAVMGWSDENYKTPSKKELAALEAKRIEAAKHREKVLQKQHEAAASASLKVWDTSTPAKPDHPYLFIKGVKVHGIKQQGNDLIVPVRIDGKLSSIQRIKPDGVTKLFQKGGATRGGYFSIGKPSGRIFIAEGYATGATIHEATGAAVVVAFNCGNLEPVAKAIRAKFPDIKIVIAGDSDKSNVGEIEGRKAAAAVSGKFIMPHFEDGESGTDWNDWASIHGLPAVRDEIERKITCADPEVPESAESLNDAVRRLVELSPLQYDRVRTDEAEKMGVRASTLDAEVKSRRKEQHAEGDIFPEVEPWPDAVDGGALLDEIAETFRRYVVLPKHADVVAALWTLNSYVHNASYHSPMVILTSPEKRCGKTTAMMVFMALCNRPLPASGVSGAVVFRAIEKWHPTLMIDEVDAFLADKDDLRGILNAGNTKPTARVMRCDGDQNEPKVFSVWCPKILSGIGRISDTLEDRSILFPLRRKLPDERVARLRLDRGGFDEIKQKCVRWGEDNLAKVAASDPAIPAGLNDRAADNWTPLLAIADLCGWREKAEAAAMILSGDTDGGGSVNVMLLADVRKIFKKQEPDKVSSQSICDDLAKMEDRPWPEWYKGRPITTRQLAKRLGGFGIHPKKIRIAEDTLQGYERHAFADAFRRYLPSPSGTPEQVKGHNAFSDNTSGTQGASVPDRKTPKPLQDNSCSSVPDRNTVDGDCVPFDDPVPADSARVSVSI